MLPKYNTMCTQNSYHKICEECGKEFITLMPTNTTAQTAAPNLPTSTRKETSD